MCTYFKTETDVAQILIDEFLSNFDSLLSEDLSTGRTFLKKLKKYVKYLEKDSMYG